MWNSFWFAALSATLSGAAGLAWWRWRGAALLWLLFLVPGVLLGIGLIYALNRGVRSLYQSAGVVILGLALRYAALSWTGARDAMKAVVPAATEFARLSGATRWHCLRHVHWPLIAPELGAIWFVTYLLCLWDVETLVLIIPPGCETLALRIFNLLHYGHNGQVNALCAILLGVAILPLLLRGSEPGRRWNWPPGRPSGDGRIRLSLGLSACGRAPSEGAAIRSAIFSSVQIVGSRGTASRPVQQAPFTHR